MKRIIRAIVIAISLIVMLAVPVLAYTYSSTIVIANSTATPYTMLPVIAAENNTYYASHNYINSSANDTRVQSAGVYIPHMIADNATLFARAIGASTNDQVQYLFSETPKSSMPIVLGYGGYITTADNATLELSSNFTVQTSAYIDTTNVTSDIVEKGGAIRTYISGTNALTTQVSGTTPAIYRPSGAGDLTQFPSQNPAATFHWDKVAEVIADDAATTVYDDSGAFVERYDSYTISSLSPVPVGGVIDHIDVTIRGMRNNASSQYFGSLLRLGGVTVKGTSRTPALNTWTTYTETIARPGGGTWSLADLTTLQIGAFEKSDWTIYITQVYITVYYSMTLTVSGITPELYPISTSYDGTTLTFTVGASNNSTVIPINVPDTANNWIFMSTATPYTDNISIITGGTYKLLYRPNSIILVNSMPDLVGVQNGVITWGANPVGITASMSGGINPVTVINSTPTNTQARQDITPTININSGSGNAPSDISAPNNAISPLINAISSLWRLDTKLNVMWIVICLILTILAFGLTFIATKHLFLAGLAGSIVVCFFDFALHAMPHLTSIFMIIITILLAIFDARKAR